MPTAAIHTDGEAPVEYHDPERGGLAALIDAAVAEAVAATEQTAQAVAYTTSDGPSPAKRWRPSIYYDYAEYTIAYAGELMDVYHDLYGALADRMIDELVGWNPNWRN